MTTFSFTATANSLAVAKRIGGTLVSIPQVIYADNQHYKDDAIGVVFPIYWWSPPLMVKRFLENAEFESNYIFAVGTYGSIVGGAMASLLTYADKNSYSIDYINHVQMLDNYLPAFDMEVREKELEKRHVTENIAEIVSDIASRKSLKAKNHLGKRIMSAAMDGRFKPELNARQYIVDEKCSKCGVCTKVCAANNIVVSDNVVFNDCCEGVFGLCPSLPTECVTP